MKTPPFAIAPGIELRLNGQLQVIESVSADGEVTLKCPLRHTRLRFELTELISMRMAGTLEPVQAARESHRPSGQPTYASMSRETRDRVLRRLAYGRTAAQLYPIGPDNPLLAELIAEVAQRIGDARPPSPHSVYRWVRRFVGSGYDTAVFMQDGAVMRRRKAQRVPDDVKSRLREHVQVLLGAYPGATLNGITNLALARTARDLGHVSFITKEGVEELAEPFIQTAEAVLRTRDAALARRRVAAPNRTKEVA